MKPWRLDFKFFVFPNVTIECDPSRFCRFLEKFAKFRVYTSYSTEREKAKEREREQARRREKQREAEHEEMRQALRDMEESRMDRMKYSSGTIMNATFEERDEWANIYYEQAAANTLVCLDFDGRNAWAGLLSAAMYGMPEIRAPGYIGVMTLYVNGAEKYGEHIGRVVLSGDTFTVRVEQILGRDVELTWRAA